MGLVIRSVRNFRDYGDVPTASGGRVVPGFLYRSAHFIEVDPTDIAHLTTLGIGVIADLRRKDEREMFPNVWPASAPPAVITCDLPQAHPSPSYEVLRDGRLSLRDVRELVRVSYATLPFEPRNQDLIGRYIRELARDRSASIVHCVAGKDRTGFVVALIQDLLNVEQTHIRRGYLASNRLLDLEARLPGRAAYLSEQFERLVTVEMLRHLMGVAIENLDVAFASIKHSFGSIERYAVDFLGCSHDELRQLRRNYVRTQAHLAERPEAS